MSHNELVTIADIELYSETDKAILIGPPGLRADYRDNLRKVWIPLSMIDTTDLDGVGSIGYIEIPEWLADKKAAEKADAVLQRQQENDQRASVERQQAALIEKVDELSTRGSEIYEDFQESVVEAGMRGDWDLTHTTIEAASEAENGVQILNDLANNPAEATKVARMSLFQQVQYVAKRDAEIGQGKQPRRIPKAGEPPANSARGANSRTQINPATDNLDDFGKLWDKT